MQAISTLSLLLPLILFSLPQILAQTDPFSPDFPSCAADPGILKIFGPAANVQVQPLCDNAINTICNTAIDAMRTAPSIQSLKATGKAPNPQGGPCEVHLLFPSNAVTFNGFIYDTCVQAFQSITTDCMLIGTGKWAQANKQAGVRGVAHDQQGEEGSVVRPVWKAASLNSVGFMAGPPGYFGNLNVSVVSDKIPENSGPGQRRRRSLTRGEGVEV